MIVASATQRDRQPAEEEPPLDLARLTARLGAGFVGVTGEASARALAAAADESVDLLYCGGFLHRLSRHEGEKLLATCFRALKPRASLRITTIDLDQIVHGFLFDWAGADDAGLSRTERLNAAFRDSAVQFIYGEEELMSLLARVGFADVRRFGIGASADERFWNLESDPAQTLIVEATKP